MAASLQSIYKVFEHQKTELLLHLLKHDETFAKTLVFVRSREVLQAVTTELNHAGLAADSISGGKKSELRDRALSQLLSGELQVIIATEAILRETDLSGISKIIHFDFHELDRDYQARSEVITGEITTFVSQNDQKDLKDLETLLGSPPESKEAPDFVYDSQPRKIRGPIKKTHASNKTGSKPLQNKKPKLKNKGPRRKTGRTRKR